MCIHTCHARVLPTNSFMQSFIMKKIQPSTIYALDDISVNKSKFLAPVKLLLGGKRPKKIKHTNYISYIPLYIRIWLVLWRTNRAWWERRLEFQKHRVRAHEKGDNWAKACRRCKSVSQIPREWVSVSAKVLRKKVTSVFEKSKRVRVAKISKR